MQLFEKIKRGDKKNTSSRVECDSVERSQIYGFSAKDEAAILFCYHDGITSI